MKTRCTAVILAAGLSRRMASFKPLLPLGGQTVTDRVIGLFREGGFNVVLVTGHRGDDLLAGIRPHGITVVHNPDYEQGMFTSVKAGVGRLPDGCRAFFVMPVDVPLVRPATVAALLDAAARNPGRIIYPVFGRARGHPPLIPAGLAPVIAATGKDGNLKAVLGARREMAYEVPVADANVLFDIDTEEDYRVLLARYQHYDIPTEEECTALFDIAATEPDKRRHGARVAEVAVSIGRELKARGEEIDVSLVRAAAVLHDIAKGQPRHDAAGGRALKDMGFGRVGDIVAVHTDLSPDGTDVSLEAEVVYLADKMVAGEQLVSIEERYSASKRRFALTPEIRAIIQRRKERAMAVMRRLENRLGRPLHEVLPV